MNFKNIGILDDSIGGINLLNSLKEIYKNENFIYFADLKEYPYGLKKRSAENLSKNTLNIILEKNLKILIVTNPTISQYINDLNILKIDGIERAFKNLKDKQLLILGSNLSIGESFLNKYLDRNSYKKEDAQLLINMAHDGDSNYYIISKLISEYVGDFEGDILLLDSNLSIFKEYFDKYSPKCKIHTLNDFIIEELKEKFTDDLRHLKSNNQKIKYFVSDYRIAFYKSAEEFFDERFSSVRKLR